MLVYISGRYSADTEEGIQHNIEVARKASIDCWQKGMYCITPHLNTINFHKQCSATYDMYMEGDFLMLDACDAIVMLPGWETSRGAVAEMLFAKDNNIPVYHYPSLPSEDDAVDLDAIEVSLMYLSLADKYLKEKHAQRLPEGKTAHPRNSYDAVAGS